MPNVRKPKPRPQPSNLRELVLDIDQRLEGGDPSSDVWLPGTDWVTLCAAAEAEQRLAAAESDAATRAAKSDAKKAKSDAEVMRILEAGHDETRKLLAKSLGAGVDSSWGELFEVARGYVMALDAERERVVQRVAEVVATSRAADNAPASQPSKLRCPRCLGNCANEARGNCTRAAGRTRYQVLSELDEQQRRELAADHPNWFCQDRATGAECVLQEEHAGDCMAFGDLAAEYAPEEPEHPECPHCGEADGHKPKDCAMLERAEEPEDDRPTMVESMERADAEERASACRRRLNGTAWKRAAAEAREANSLDTCHHCGVEGDDVGDLVVSRNSPVLPDGVFCGACQERLEHNPDDWQRHFRAAEPKSPKRGGRKAKQVTLEEAVAATKPRPPGRATKKFPKGGTDLAEKCTQCGAELGEHDGTKCPKPALRGGTVPIHEQQETAEAVA